MDVDHEARKHNVHPSTIEGEAKRTAAEDPAEQIRGVLHGAKNAVDPETACADQRDPEAPDAHRAKARRSHRKSSPEKAARETDREQG